MMMMIFCFESTQGGSWGVDHTFIYTYMKCYGISPSFGNSLNCLFPFENCEFQNFHHHMKIMSIKFELSYESCRFLISVPIWKLWISNFPYHRKSLGFKIAFIFWNCEFQISAPISNLWVSDLQSQLRKESSKFPFPFGNCGFQISVSIWKLCFFLHLV